MNEPCLVQVNWDPAEYEAVRPPAGPGDDTIHLGRWNLGRWTVGVTTQEEDETASSY